MDATQKLPHGAKLLRELLTLYSTGGLGQEGQDLFNASLVVPLYKNEAGTAVRPIAIPSVHRKVLAKTTVAAFRGELQAAAGPAQHAAMASNGTLRMAQRVQTHLRREHRDCIYIRTDIQNAFNEVDRQAALDALERAHPTLAAMHFAWLHQPTTAVMQASSGVRSLLTTHAGIPQGDPISSLAFGLVLAQPLTQMQTLPRCDPWAYADDTVIACPPAVASEYLRAWADSLATVGLKLNPAKIHIWNPQDLALPEALLAQFPTAEVTVDGFKVCGLPLEYADPTDPHDFTPLGCGPFTRTFLAAAPESLLLRLRALSTVVANMGSHTEALHIALRIARVNLQGRHVHLYRFCDRQIMREWTATLAIDTQTWLAELLDLPLGTPHAQAITALPASLGGLGFLNPQHEAALHFLQAVLPHVEELPAGEDDDTAQTRDIAAALDFLDDQGRTQLRPKIQHLAPHRMGERLRQEFYEAMRLQMLELCPWLQAPGLPTANSTQADISWRWQGTHHDGLVQWLSSRAPPKRTAEVCHPKASGTPPVCTRPALPLHTPYYRTSMPSRPGGLQRSRLHVCPGTRRQTP